jgi:nucleotide-binding universal stress UspA family protein
MSAPGTAPGGIVCGVDGSAHARHAAIAALTLAERLGTRLTLVHVAPARSLLPVASPRADVETSASARSADVAKSEADEAFASMSPEISRANADREVRRGKPAGVLAELADERGAELIVVGSRGRGAWRSAALGSVSAELIRLAPCPVMIVPERAGMEQQTA